MTSKELAKIAYNALDDKKGVNITIIDISEISIIADYFIIAGGTNENQVKALAGNVEDEFAKAGLSLSEEKREIAAYVSKALSFVRKMQKFLATPQEIGRASCRERV